MEIRTQMRVTHSHTGGPGAHTTDGCSTDWGGREGGTLDGVLVSLTEEIRRLYLDDGLGLREVGAD